MKKKKGIKEELERKLTGSEVVLLSVIIGLFMFILILLAILIGRPAFNPETDVFIYSLNEESRYRLLSRLH